MAAAVWLTLTLRQVYQVSSYYGGLTALSAPLRSVAHFTDLAADCTVGQWLAGCLLLRLLVLLAAAMTGCLLSSLCRTVNAAVVVCCAGLVGGRHPVPGPPVDPRYLLPVCLSHPPGSADSLPPSVRAAQAQGLIC